MNCFEHRNLFTGQNSARWRKSMATFTSCTCSNSADGDGGYTLPGEQFDPSFATFYPVLFWLLGLVSLLDLLHWCVSSDVLVVLLPEWSGMLV